MQRGFFHGLLSLDAATAARNPLALLDGKVIQGGHVFLSYVQDVVADSEGRVYVIDSQEAGVIALNADLSHDRTIGREGEGPGEFTRPGSMQVLSGDSLLVWTISHNASPCSHPETTRPRTSIRWALRSSVPKHAGLRDPPDTSPSRRPHTWRTAPTKARRGSRSCVMSVRRGAASWTRWCTSIPPASLWSSGGKEPSACPAIPSDEVPSRRFWGVNKSHMRVPTPWR